MGDFSCPYGTYYNNNGGTTATYWNIFDQVIIRPAIRKRFNDKNLKILTSVSGRSLLDANGHPDINISDHLPIMFEIKEDCSSGESA